MRWTQRWLAWIPQQRSASEAPLSFPAIAEQHLKPGIAHQAVPGLLFWRVTRVIVNANNVVNQDFGEEALPATNS